MSQPGENIRAQDSPPGPELSVVIVTAVGGESIAKVLRRLESQTIRERIEVIVVAPPAADLSVLLATPGLCILVAPITQLAAMGAARASGVRTARGAIVAFLEDHCFPLPKWAERVLAAHAGSYAAIGPLMGNANPNTAVSWANLLIDYGPWVFVSQPTEMDYLPGHNGSYQRAVLLGFGDRLETLLDAECVLHWELRRRGERLLLDPGIKVQHLNYSLFGKSVRLRWCCGRAFAAARTTDWTVWRRSGFALAAPLIPLVRLIRIVRSVRAAASHKPQLSTLLPALTFLLVVDGFGEGCGYLFGAGDVRRKLTSLETCRDLNLLPNERRTAFV